MNTKTTVGGTLDLDKVKINIGSIKVGELIVDFGSASGLDAKGDYLGKDRKNTFNAGVGIKTPVGGVEYNYEKIYGPKDENNADGNAGKYSVEYSKEAGALHGGGAAVNTEEGGSISVKKSVSGGLIIVPSASIEIGIRKVETDE